VCLAQGTGTWVVALYWREIPKQHLLLLTVWLAGVDCNCSGVRLQLFSFQLSRRLLG
jgi:hypothetical protein